MVKMSPDDSTTFSERFEKYARDNPQYQSSKNREEFRTFIWLKENIHNPKDRTKEDNRKIRQIQRYLKKFYDRQEWLENKVKELNKEAKIWFTDVREFMKFFELIETEEDYRDFQKLKETLLRRKLGKEQKEEQEDKQKILKEK